MVAPRACVNSLQMTLPLNLGNAVKGVVLWIFRRPAWHHDGRRHKADPSNVDSYKGFIQVLLHKWSGLASFLVWDATMGWRVPFKGPCTSQVRLYGGGSQESSGHPLSGGEPASGTPR